MKGIETDTRHTGKLMRYHPIKFPDMKGIET